LIAKQALSYQEDTVKEVETTVQSQVQGGEGPARAEFSILSVYPKIPRQMSSSFPFATTPCTSAREDLLSRDTVNTEAFALRSECGIPLAQPRLCLHGMNRKRRTRPTCDARYGQATAAKPLTLSHGAQTGALVHGHKQPLRLAVVYTAAHGHCVA
jgi:hypothetical protein